MINLMKADLFKVRKSMYLKACFLVTAVAAVLLALASHLLLENSMAEGGVNIIFLSSESEIIFLMTDIQMIALVGSVFVALLIGGDFENETVASAIAAGHRRGTVIASKIIVLMIVMAVLLLPYMLAAAVACFSSFDFAVFSPSTFLMIMASPGGEISAFAAVLKIIAIWLTMAVVYTAQMSIAVVLIFAFKKALAVMMIAYTIFFIMGQLAVMEGLAGRVLSYTPFGIWQMDLTLSADGTVFSRALGISLLFTAAMGLLTWLLFCRSEIR